jgi:hypothetical protein
MPVKLTWIKKKHTHTHTTSTRHVRTRQVKVKVPQQIRRSRRGYRIAVLFGVLSPTWWHCFYFDTLTNTLHVSGIYHPSSGATTANWCGWYNNLWVMGPVGCYSRLVLFIALCNVYWLFLDLGAWSGWLVSTMPRPPLPPENARYPLYRRLGGPQGQSGRVRKILLPPGFDPRKVQHVASRYTDWATGPPNITCITP